MKYVKGLCLVFVLFVMTILVMTGCSGDNGTGSKDSLVGIWKLNKVKMTMEGVTLEMTAAALGMNQTLEIKSDGTYSMVSVEEGTTVTETGTWSVSDSKLTVDPDEPGEETEVMDYKISGNTLTFWRTEEMEMEDGTIADVPMEAIFVRQ